MNQGTITGSPIGRRISLAALVAVLGVLLFLLPGLLVQAQDSTTIEYTENSKDAVVTLSAGDPEGATPVTWSLPTWAAAGDVPDAASPLVFGDAQDNDVFKISQSGVLEFMSPPDFDAPADDGTNNVYNVVVQASDGDAGNNAYTGTDVATPIEDPGVNMVDNDDTRSWFKVIVNVSDVNEPGSIRMHYTEHAASTLLQPQIEVEITAAGLTDEDGTPAPGVAGATYKWQRSSGPNGPWTDIDGERSATYTPQQAVTGEDLGKYLQVVATYNEAGAGGRGAQTARAKSMYPTIQVVGDNNAPSFAEGAAVVRPVRENSAVGTNIGAPVVATNPESGSPHNEKLTYWLTGATAPDTLPTGIPVGATITPTDADLVASLFSIDAATGQLTTKTSLDSDASPYYVVTVNVADSSDNIPANTATIAVIIRVLQTNDAPTIAGAATIEHVEGGTALDTDLGTADTQVAMYDATDEDPTNTTLTFSLSGADKDLFQLRDTTAAEESDSDTPAGTTRQVLEFKAKPDYEDPADANNDNVYQVTVEVFDGEATAKKDVTVKVTNMQEDGKVEVTPAQPRIGIELTAALTDSDIVSYGPMWQWQRSLGAATDTSCTDKDAERNVWTNIPGAGSAAFTPRAIDLSYCLSAVARYNDGYHEYVTAPTPVTTPGASGLYTDDDTRFDKTANMTLSSVQYPTEPNVTPVFASAMTKRFVLENATVNNPVGKPVTAVDGNGPDDALEYELSGDTDAFSIHPETGQLTTKMEFDHESKNKYTVTVTATDTHGASASTRVEIYVVDVDEGPEGYTSPDGGLPYTENSKDVVLTLSVSDPEGATPVTWSLVEALETPVQMIDGVALTADDIADHAQFKIDPRSGVLEFKNPPDFDAPADDGTNNTYNIVVQASDGDAGNNAFTGTDVATPIEDPGVNMVDNDDTRSWFKVVVNVSDVNEPGSIRMHYTEHAASTLLQPQIEVPITAAGLMDQDGTPAPGITGATYQWQRSSGANGPWTDIDGETGTTYTPQQLVTGEDLSKYLQVVATYTEAGTDGRGGQTASAKSMYPTIQVVGDNTAPSFAEDAATTRPVRENSAAGTNIGVPVVATNPESGSPHNEKLTYWLSEASSAPDAATLTSIGIPTGATITPTDADLVASLFAIDAATGQLTTKTRLNSDENPYYVVTVNVADSSDNTPLNTDAIPVVIRVLQTNDAPMIAGAATIEHVEGGTALDTDLGTADTQVAMYDATDEDPTNTTLTFSLSGADKDLFQLRDTTAAEESDSDTPAGTTRQVLEFKAKPDYEDPADANNDNVYQVTVEVFDGEATAKKDVTVKVTNMQEDGKVEVTPAQPRIGIELTAALTDSDIVSYGPMWQWQRSLGAATDTSCTDKDAERNVWTNIPGAGSAAFTPRAIDLSYCLSAVARYNDGYHEYVTAPTPVTTPGASGLYTDDDTRFDKTANMTLSSVQYPTEPNVTPVFASAMTKRFVLENATVNNPVGKPVTAVDGNGPDDALEYELSGDTDAFSISPGTGQLMTKMKFNHETNLKYTVTVTATDTHGATDTIRVDIYVVDVDEMLAIVPSGLSISGGTSFRYPEGGMDTVDTYMAMAFGPDAAMATLTLGGDDAGDFTFRGGVLSFRNSPDYENPVDMDMDNTYMVTVKATDGTYTAMKDVTVAVIDVDELGRLTADMGSPISYMENGAMPVATYMADGPMADYAMWTLEGADANHFMLDGTGMSTMLKFKSAPDYENPADADTDNTYMVTVKAEAGGEMEMVEVNVMVTDVDELVTLSGPGSASNPEGMDTVGTYMASGGDGSTLNWSLEDADSSHFMLHRVEGSDMSRMLKFSSAPDFEMPRGAAKSDTNTNTYMVTVKAESGGEMATQAVTVTVTNMDELGTVTLAPTRPSVGTPITATLADEDSGVANTAWQWASADAMDGTFTNIDGATSDSYTPVEADAGMYLMATATYEDVHGSGQTASSEAVMVSADAAGGYDANNDGVIAISELFAAIDDYFANQISISELFEVIDAYFG